MTDDSTLRQALACARRGWPVFPCQAGQKIPATAHGSRDATTDPDQITEWFTRYPSHNLAIATGAPGPDVLDVDQHSSSGNGYTALARIRRAGLLHGAPVYVRTPSRRLHRYFTGTTQHRGHLPARGRRLHPGPALPGRRPLLPARHDHRPSRLPRLGRRHPAAATRPAAPPDRTPSSPRP